VLWQLQPLSVEIYLISADLFQGKCSLLRVVPAFVNGVLSVIILELEAGHP
jgi:hypothetical protein